MAVSKTVITCLRSIALVGTVLLFALGVWTLVTINAIDDRGTAVLSTFQARLGADAPSWSQYITAARNGSARAWVLTVLSSTTALATLLIITSNRYYWLRIATPALTILELTSFLSSIITFGLAVSLAVSLRAFNPPSLPTLDSADLTTFTHLLPLSRGLALTATVILPPSSLALALSLRALQQRRTQRRDTRAFEPTASALGMSHGFLALHPRPATLRQPIPTMYDPYGAFRKGPAGAPLGFTKQVAFADEAPAAASRWSASSMGSPRRAVVAGKAGGGADAVRLLDVKRARRAVPVRPVGDAGMELRSGGNCI
ncbi:hypothetical protein G6514_003313 [Epicoccum nigrum]|nr:hypothetical protein G6514_003313 [Epicoccum nigrum]